MKIAVIGSGSAGIYTALFLKDFFDDVVLFEKDKKIGKKLKITGGGRMNLGNKRFSDKCFVSSEKNILKNIFKNPHAKDVLSLFKEIGTEYKWEENRAILSSEDGAKEVNRLEKLLGRQENLTLCKNTEIKAIQAKNGYFLVNSEKFDFVVITSGSQVRIGEKLSEQEAYILPYSLGHTLTKIEPALCPLILENCLFQGLEGLSLECCLRNPENKEKITGNVLFTHQGLSGPAVLDFTMYELENEIELNFMPNFAENDFKIKIEKDRKGKVLLKKFLSQYLPKKMVLWQMGKSGIEADKIIANLSKNEAKDLIQNIYHLKIKNPKKSPVQFGWTVRGGVVLKEINPATLESKVHKNLFFAGEILDITGLCGGFNISFAMLSAKIVSEAILKKK